MNTSHFDSVNYNCFTFFRKDFICHKTGLSRYAFRVPNCSKTHVRAFILPKFFRGIAPDFNLKGKGMGKKGGKRKELRERKRGEARRKERRTGRNEGNILPPQEQTAVAAYVLLS
jgi:hypothetical protein